MNSYELSKLIMVGIQYRLINRTIYLGVKYVIKVRESESILTSLFGFSWKNYWPNVTAEF